VSLKFINRVGVELEGGWVDKPPENIHEDISVKNNTDGFPALVDKKGKKCQHWGETASPPLSLAAALRYIKDNYPDGSNDSCGFHVHISVRRPIDYARLMKRGFWTEFLAAVREWGEKQKLPLTHQFWSRLDGENRFARKLFRPLSQIGITEKDGRGSGPQGRETRRTLLNYCWAMHKTLECRLFPAWETPELAQSATSFFVNFVEVYLAEKSKRKARLKNSYNVYTVKRLEAMLKKEKPRDEPGATEEVF